MKNTTEPTERNALESKIADAGDAAGRCVAAILTVLWAMRTGTMSAATTEKAADLTLGPSGTPQTAARRRELGGVQLATWLSREAAARLDALASEWGVSKREALERIIGQTK